jgi:hypothetical protein
VKNGQALEKQTCLSWAHIESTYIILTDCTQSNYKILNFKKSYTEFTISNKKAAKHKYVLNITYKNNCNRYFPLHLLVRANVETSTSLYFM